MKLSETVSPSCALKHPPLRDWQQRCVAQAMQKLSPAQRHFLCQATPGAGKMLMAAVLAGQLLQRGDIDFVLYLGPSREVVSRAEQTFSEVTGLTMNGQAGAQGGCYTYHSLRSRLREFQTLGQRYRVLLVWDESHHAGRLPGTWQGANEWGQALLLLERVMTLTLALSGTPWRTDGSCLPLLRYLDVPDKVSSSDSEEAALQQRLMPDFVYTLQQAVRDGVCRRPLIHLIDSPSIRLTMPPNKDKQPPREQHFSSIPGLLRDSPVRYADLLRHDAPMTYVLRQGMAILAALRRVQPKTGGLVVASDIEHAEDIAEWLAAQGEDVCLVTSQTPNAHARLQAFRETDQAWVVSVGMISEGVDIPRLRVCCYLSRVRTEQYFRQVLGRVIRRMGRQDPECYLIVLNEPLLRRYANRIADDLPDEQAIVSVVDTDAPVPGNAGRHHMAAPDTFSAIDASVNDAATTAAIMLNGLSTAETAPSWQHDMVFSKRFITRLATLKL